jgi:hypothetical protein
MRVFVLKALAYQIGNECSNNDVGALWENFLVSERKKRNALLFVTEGDLPWYLITWQSPR